MQPHSFATSFPDRESFIMQRLFFFFLPKSSIKQTDYFTTHSLCMFSRFRQAIFGIPLLSQAPRHAAYNGPTTPTAIAQSQTANMASSANGANGSANGNVEVATVANGYVYSMSLRSFSRERSDMSFSWISAGEARRT